MTRSNPSLAKASGITPIKMAAAMTRRIWVRLWVPFLDLLAGQFIRMPKNKR
jgi:hypothetical protein